MVLIAGLVMGKVSDVEPFSGIVAAPNAFTMVGGVATDRFAVAVLPVPPLVELTLPVVLTKFPEAVPVTFTVNVQLLLTAIVPPASDTLPDPATAVATPPHVLVNPFGVATTSPAGNVSVNATPFSEVVLAAGLVMVKVNDVVPFSGTLAAPNTLMISGGATTVMLAFEVFPVPLFVNVPCTRLFFTVSVVPVTFTETVHLPLPPKVPPPKLTVPDPATAVAAPPHVLL